MQNSDKEQRCLNPIRKTHHFVEQLQDFSFDALVCQFAYTA